MSASIEGFPRHALPLPRLTITEAKVEGKIEPVRKPVLGSSKSQGHREELGQPCVTTACST